MLLDVTFGQQDDGHPNEWQHHQDNQQGDGDALPVSVSSDRSDVLHVKRRTLFQCLGVERCQVKQAKQKDIVMEYIQLDVGKKRFWPHTLNEILKANPRTTNAPQR